MNRGLLLVALALVISASPGISRAAPELDQCPAKKYKVCSAFSTSVEIGEHEPIIDNHLAGFSRSKGAWKISVRYQPEVECAKVNILLNMGPIDPLRQYKETFRDGGGVISDSGTFMHKIDDLQSALRIPHSSCYVPDEGETKRAALAEDGKRSKDELERLALEEERERLALEREREQRELEKERERLALERERLELEQEFEAEQERRWLAQERERRRLAEQQRERELERQESVSQQDSSVGNPTPHRTTT